MRASWADAALSVFMQHTGCDREDALGDLLANLMHWSEQHGFAFDLALDRARDHFEAELLEELPPPPEAEEHSAPTLFDALSRLMEALRLTRHGYVLGTTERDADEELLASARAALAQAKGGAQ